MPIFEYRCSDCETRFEELVLSRNSEPVVCSDCGSASVERLFSTFAAQTSSAGSQSAFACGPSSGIA